MTRLAYGSQPSGRCSVKNGELYERKCYIHVNPKLAHQTADNLLYDTNGLLQEPIVGSGNDRRRPLGCFQR